MDARSHERGPKRPNFLIIGAARSGTTALAQFIAAHPLAFVTQPKEPHFLALGGSTAPFTGPGDDEMMNRVRVASPRQYERLFERADGALARGEGSVSTMYYADEAIPRIREFCEPGVRLLALVRHPVERAHSSFLYMRARGHEPFADFDRALDLEAGRIRAGWHHMWHYTAMSRYREQLPAFIEAFGAAQVKIVLHDELTADPQGTMAGVFEHLGLPFAAVDAAPEVNRGGEVRSASVQHLMQLLRSWEPARVLAKKITSSRFRERVRAANLRHPPLEPRTRARLAALHKDDIAYIAELTGGRSACWNA